MTMRCPYQIAGACFVLLAIFVAVEARGLGWLVPLRPARSQRARMILP